jgi:hypothetical protein
MSVEGISRITYSTQHYSLGISENVALAMLAPANLSDARDGMLCPHGGLSYRYMHACRLNSIIQPAGSIGPSSDEISVVGPS